MRHRWDRRSRAVQYDQFTMSFAGRVRTVALIYQNGLAGSRNAGVAPDTAHSFSCLMKAVRERCRILQGPIASCPIRIHLFSDTLTGTNRIEYDSTHWRSRFRSHRSSAPIADLWSYDSSGARESPSSGLFAIPASGGTRCAIRERTVLHVSRCDPSASRGLSSLLQ